MDAFLLTKSLRRRETFVNFGSMSLDKILFFILMPVSLLAAFLAWNAGSSDHILLRIIVTVFAFIFSVLYIVGYVIFKIITLLSNIKIKYCTIV